MSAFDQRGQQVGGTQVNVGDNSPEGELYNALHKLLVIHGCVQSDQCKVCRTVRVVLDRYR